MGSFYNNVTLVGVGIDDARPAVSGPALVAASGTDVVVFAEASEAFHPVGEDLASALGCVAVSIGVHDDDILTIEVHHGADALGSLAVPDPAEVFGPEFGSDGQAEASLLDAAGLVEAVGRGDTAQVEAALLDDFVFASERHRALAKALGLPTAAVGWGYRYLTTEPDGYQGPALIRLPA